MPSHPFVSSAPPMPTDRPTLLLDDGTFASTWDIDTDPAEIIGTGPFTIEEYDPGERVAMRRNPNYWLEDGEGNSLPYLDEIVHVIVPDLEAELDKFLTGEADFHGVLGKELGELEPLQDEGNFTIYKRGPRFRDNFPRIQHEPRQEPGHRRALSRPREA